MPTEEAKSLARILDTLGLSTAQAALEQNKAPFIDPELSRVTLPLATPPPTRDQVVPLDQLPMNVSFPFGSDAIDLVSHADLQAPQLQGPSQKNTAKAIADWDWSPAEHEYNYALGVNIASVRAPGHPLLGTYSGKAALSDNDENDAGSDTTEEDLVNQLSDRLGCLRIGPNGQISYFGPTSNFSLVELPTLSDTLSIDRTVRNDGQEHLDNMGYGKPVPPDLEEHLISLYFAWQDPFSHVVDRALYEEAKYEWLEREEETSYYSEALKNAMFVLTTELHRSCIRVHG
ncbi:fungal specific transcription factor [Colletotrichum tofieldiae]|nr:fungal specific transcription factor [Colletotrichum tofieldiae]GKT69375.1 fungal specific transcription factor [Colletotrichum tofieldiae]GKT96324.1 fungal specific transcription factor [Colletotrichum tofieldiae]